MDTTLTPTTVSADNLELKTFSYMDYKCQDMEEDVDPDNNFFNDLVDNCCYDTMDQYNRTVKVDNKLSIIHFNSRSLYANFNSIKDCLSQFKQPFSIIAISETWISSEKGADFDLEGYEFNYINREGKTGEGVAVYVDRNFK